MRPISLHGGRTDETTDPRAAAVLEVLSGKPARQVARRWSVDVTLLHRWVLAFVDAGTAQVTNRPDANAAAQRDRFLAAFAHEVRTPLSVAQGWVAMLLDDDVPPEAMTDSVQRLHDALGRLSERTRDVELLAAASLGRISLASEPIAVGDLVEDLPGLGLVHGDGPHAVVDVDPELFRRVLRDLWQAGHSLPTPRAVRMFVATVSPWVEIRVVRSADPVDPAVLQALFEPFDLNDDGTGVTIGLYLARALVVAHGGTIGVEQDEHGAALWVRIPARPHHARSSRAHPHGGLMKFKLACGDVMPGCTAHFESTHRDQLLSQVAEHAAEAHGIIDITPDIMRAVESKLAVSS